MEKQTKALRISALALFFTAVLIVACACATGRKKPAQPRIDVGALQKDLVARLSGRTEIRSGIKLANRSSVENRQEARTYLMDLWESLGLEVQKQAYSAEGENIFAIIKAAKASDEYVIFGAHYDTSRVSPGANDNATGAAVVTAAAYEISRARPRSRNFFFVLFDEEERGLRGSKAFAQKLKDENLKVHSVHTIDQMGWDGDGDRAIELEIPYEGAVDLYQKSAKSLTPPIPILTTQEPGSDHSAFRKLGYRAVGITEEYRNRDTTPHIHKATDTFETIRFDYLESTTDLVVRVLQALARKGE